MPGDIKVMKKTTENDNLLQKIKGNLPRHIAVIMDGNGRWAAARRLPRIEGHRAGSKAVRETVTACRELEIPFLTLYAFSEENWDRPKSEVQALMTLLQQFLRERIKELKKHQIAFDVIGEEERLSSAVRKEIERARAVTASGEEKMRLTLALSYGARSEIVRAARMLAGEVAEGKRNLEEITKESFSEALYTAGMPDPDLLIRTSGELRVSNFLLWQIAYTEMWITPVLWPDFRKEHLLQALEDYARRDRRFGKVRNR